MLKIITDHKWKPFLYGYELSENEKRDFDWVEDIEMANFIRYRKRVYCDQEFICFGYLGNQHPVEFLAWDGYLGDSYFSGVVIKISPDGESYKIGTYIS